MPGTHEVQESRGAPAPGPPASPHRLTQRPAVHLVRIETTRWPGAWLREFSELRLEQEGCQAGLGVRTVLWAVGAMEGSRAGSTWWWRETAMGALVGGCSPSQDVRLLD